MCDGWRVLYHGWRQWMTTAKSEDHPENVKFICKTKFPAKVLLWLAVSESSINKPVFFKVGLAVNIEVYVSKWLTVLHIFIQKHHKKIVFWSDLASAQYAKDKLIRLPELKIEYNPKEKKSQNVHSYGRLKFFGRTWEGRSTATIMVQKCKVLDGKDQKRAEVYWNYGKS
jgi:hypothetical protein